jgi:hypothetical protein
MNPKTKKILAFTLSAASLGLALITLFFWQPTPPGSIGWFFHSLCFDQLFLVMGIEGVLRSKRQWRELGYSQPASFWAWVMVGFFFVLLARQLWILWG